MWTAFGAAICALYRLAARVQLAEGPEGVAVALDMHPAAVAAPPRERRAHRLVDLAEGREAAVRALLATSSFHRSQGLP
ncbi:hypothetical protein ACF073_36470 [Streptomyces sp. NPDC015171]|uniref:hypothetical protein n=1 Tax=Streptomyces sp. NPDC015171 TaxID=3364945 RepID=UPI0036FE90EF